jgi:GNAT superfamily N-acetyltransferase
MTNTSITYRTEITQKDQRHVREIIHSSGFFHEAEIDIAVELVQERLQKGVASGYYFIFADMADQTVAYSCFGPIPATKYSYDLYWIAVHASMRGQGIGKALLEKSEQIIREMGGQRIYIETSGRELYIPTRQFYLGCHYQEAAILTDFYAPGDAKYIYVKVV